MFYYFRSKTRLIMVTLCTGSGLGVTGRCLQWGQMLVQSHPHSPRLLNASGTGLGHMGDD